MNIFVDPSGLSTRCEQISRVPWLEHYKVAMKAFSSILSSQGKTESYSALQLCFPFSVRGGNAVSEPTH